MGSSRKFKNGMWKDESKEQERVSQGLFRRLSCLLGDKFQYMRTDFNQVTGECGYTYESADNSYYMLLDRRGNVIQEASTSK